MLRWFFSDTFLDKEVLFINPLKQEALLKFLHIKKKRSCKPPLCLFGNNIHVTQIAYLTLSSVFESNEVPFRTRGRNSQASV